MEAVDSVGANIAESVGRAHFKESRNFLIYARGSMAETEHCIRQSVRRKLFKPEIIDTLRSESKILHKQLNAFMAAQQPLPKQRSQDNGAIANSDSLIKEDAPEYHVIELDFSTDSAPPTVHSQEPRA